jgi:hypothetical protein
MNHVPGAVSLARALVALSRGHSTGVLTVCSPYDVCRIAVVDGVPRAATSKRSGATLGDVLLRAGDLDAKKHMQALESAAPHWPVGAWLVQAGVATRPAVEHALRSQLRARILDVFHWQGLDYRFAAGVADVGVPWISEPVATADLVLSALRRVVDRASATRIAIGLRHATLTLSPLGRALLAQAALWPDEAAMVPLLERSTDLAALRAASGGSDRALATLSALFLLSAVVVRDVPRARYQLLLRKHRQLCSQAAAADLLDLPRGAAPSEARRALRRLARSVHPDVLGPDVPAALRARSSELMSALGRAEREVRAAGTRRRVVAR